MSYPTSPGWKENSTSKESAKQIQPHARTVREQVADLYRRGDFTADEIAHMLNESILTVRPRVTELVMQGRLEDTGLRRTNASGHKAKVLKWITAGQGQGKLF